MGAARGVVRPVSSGRRPCWPASYRALRARGGGRSRTGRTGGGRSGGRDWDALSDGVRKRYTGAGITREAYESGADLALARGHRP